MGSPPLAELQQALGRVLTEPRGVDAALETAAGRRAAPWVVETASLGRRPRLAVYADAHFARLLQALEHDFPSVRAVLGEAEFRELAAAYLVRHPPSSPNLTDLGESLAVFAEVDKRPWLAPLAALDWAVLGAVYSDRGVPLDPGELRKLPQTEWPSLRFAFSPALRLLKADWDVDRVWRLRRAGKAKAPRRAAKSLAVFRAEDWARVEPLSAVEADALELLMKGGTLGEACERGYPPLDRWFSLGWLTGAAQDLNLA